MLISYADRPFQTLFKEVGVLRFIGPDNVFRSESVVTKLVEKMGSQGKIANTWGRQGHTGAQARAQGFYNIIKKYRFVRRMAFGL